MSKVLVYNVSTGEPIEYLASANTPTYAGRPDVIMSPDPTLIAKGIIYLKVQGGVLMEKTAAEKAAVDAAIAAASVNPLIEIKARITTLETDMAKAKTDIIDLKNKP